MLHAFLLAPRHELVVAFMDAGIRTTVVVERGQFSQSVDDVIEVEDITNPMHIVDELLSYGVKIGDSHSVCVGLGDLTSLIASAINELLGIGDHKYNPVSPLLFFKNKPMLRELLAKKLPQYTGYFRVAEDYESIKEALRHSPDGIVLKPIAGSGSRDVQRIYQQDELEEYKPHIIFPVLVEELFSGPEYSVEVLTINGKHQALAVTEKILGGESGVVEIGQLQPATISDSVKKILFDATFELLDAVDIRFGLSHTEIILQGQVPKIVESHGRVGGDRIADLLRYTTGFDAFTRLAHALSTEDFLPIEPQYSWSRIDFIDLRACELSDEEWMNKTLSEPNIVQAKILKSAQERGPICCSSDRHAFKISVSD